MDNRNLVKMKDSRRKEKINLDFWIDWFLDQGFWGLEFKSTSGDGGSDRGLSSFKHERSPLPLGEET